LPRQRRTKHPRRASTDYNGIKAFHIFTLSLTWSRIVKSSGWSHQRGVVRKETCH